MFAGECQFARTRSWEAFKRMTSLASVLLAARRSCDVTGGCAGACGWTPTCIVASRSLATCSSRSRARMPPDSRKLLGVLALLLGDEVPRLGVRQPANGMCMKHNARPSCRNSRVRPGGHVLVFVPEVLRGMIMRGGGCPSISNTDRYTCCTAVCVSRHAFHSSKLYPNDPETHCTGRCVHRRS